MQSHTPVCVKCRCDFECFKNAVGYLEVIKQEGKPDFPAAIWEADAYKCPQCGVEIIVGFSGRAIEHWQGPHFERSIEYHRKGHTLFTEKKHEWKVLPEYTGSGEE